MTSRCGVDSLLGLCKLDCSIDMINFNKLRFIVFDIFDNSQLFLTDPRNSSIPYILSFIAKIRPEICNPCPSTFRPRTRLMNPQRSQFSLKADLPVKFPYRFNSSFILFFFFTATCVTRFLCHLLTNLSQI